MRLSLRVVVVKRGSIKSRMEAIVLWSMSLAQFPTVSSPEAALTTSSFFFGEWRRYFASSLRDCRRNRRMRWQWKVIHCPDELRWRSGCCMRPVKPQWSCCPYVTLMLVPFGCKDISSSPLCSLAMLRFFSVSWIEMGLGLFDGGWSATPKEKNLKAFYFTLFKTKV